MLRNKPHLLIPVRDRRQRKRYLTLRNFGWTALAFTIAFMAVSLSSELRKPTHGEYGRLFQREVVQKPVTARSMEVVKEAPAPIDDQIAADPMLVAPAARQQQWLVADVQPVVPTTASVYRDPSTAATARDSNARVSVVGGPEGVAVVQDQRSRPVLRGGFMRDEQR